MHTMYTIITIIYRSRESTFYPQEFMKSLANGTVIGGLNSAFIILQRFPFSPYPDQRFAASVSSTKDANRLFVGSVLVQRSYGLIILLFENLNQIENAGYRVICRAESICHLRKPPTRFFTRKKSCSLP